MQYNEEIICYCFNKRCRNSIYYNDTCVPVSVSLETALSATIYCDECGKELVSTVLIEMKKDILESFRREHQCNIFILDDDLIYHNAVKIMLEKYNLLNVNLYADGYAVLKDLENNKDDKKKLPDVIFLDLGMPQMDGWEFLNFFQNIKNQLSKRISIYIISSSIDPLDHDRSKKYPFVKSFISKPLTQHFLEKVNTELMAL